MKISKELLQCLNKHLTIDKVISNGQNRIDNNIYWNVKEIDILQSRNIYELAFKLKEWSYSKCYEIISYTEGCEIFQTQLDETIKYFYAETEVEAIIKACEWALKEINEKQLQH